MNNQKEHDMNEQDAARKAAETLALLDSVHPAKTDPFFYTRLHARIHASATSSAHSWRGFSVRFVLALSAIGLLLLINMYSVLSFSSRSTEALRQQAVSRCTTEYQLLTSLD
jgi:hypothetical protein